MVWLGDGCPHYFLTLCVEGRRPVLANVGMHGRLRDFLQDSRQRYGWWAGRYVIMPDHLHVLAVQSRNAVMLGAWVKALKAIVGQREFRWQTGFFDHVLRSEDNEAEKWEYIRQNPVRAGLVRSAEDWPYAGEIP
jgi:putative transposase